MAQEKKKTASRTPVTTRELRRTRFSSQPSVPEMPGIRENIDSEIRAELRRPTQRCLHRRTLSRCGNRSRDRNRPRGTPPTVRRPRLQLNINWSPTILSSMSASFDKYWTSPTSRFWRPWNKCVSSVNPSYSTSGAVPQPCGLGARVCTSTHMTTSATNTTTLTARITARTWSTLSARGFGWVKHIGVSGEGKRCNVVLRKDHLHDLKQWYNDDALREPVKKRYQLEVITPYQYVGFQPSRWETSTDIHASDIGGNYGISRRLGGRLYMRLLPLFKASEGHTNSRIMRLVKFDTSKLD